LIYDDRYHLGKRKDWKSNVKVMPGVGSGLKKLTGFTQYIITNQPGIARKDFPLLTAGKAREVCEYVVKQVNKKGGSIKRCFICPHPSPKYVRKHGLVKFKKKLVCNCKCMKPKPGMIRDALKAEKLKLKDVKIYVVGDRTSDVLAGINAGGFGIYVPFQKVEQEMVKFRKVKSKRKYLAKSFSDAVKFILRKES